MNRTEAHPVELAILLAVLVIEAAITLARTVALAETRLQAFELQIAQPLQPGQGKRTDLLRYPGNEVGQYASLLVPVVALVLVLASRRSTAAPEAPAPPPAAPLGAPRGRPQPHPLAQLATELEALPAATLRQMASTRSKRHTKRQLIGMVAACS
jgi:hypothetical protein